MTGLKTSNVEDADEVDLLHCWVLQESDENVQDEDITHNEGSIAEIDKPEEKAIVGGPRQGGHSVETLVRILALVHPLSSDLCMSFKS